MSSDSKTVVDHDNPVDLVFAEQADTQRLTEDESVRSPDAVIARIDETLDLLADATSAAAEQRAAGHYDVSIVVPVYNERDTLPEVLDRIDEVMPRSTEVVVVDDGSRDGTWHWLRSHGRRSDRTVIRRRRNHGKGSAVRIGVRHCRGRVIAIQDADLEYDPADLLRVVWPVLEGDADVVYGSRYRESGQDPSCLHRFGNRALTRLSNCFTGLRLTDMETCHKAFRGELLRSIPLRESRFGFEPEVTAKIAARGAVVMEVPTCYQPRTVAEGKKIRWRDALDAIRCMWRYRRG